MPLYLIRRELGTASKEDVDAASLRALSCAYNYDGLRWITSYWEPHSGRIFCTYEAQSEQQIIDHSAQSRIPCDEVMLVHRVEPGSYADQVPLSAGTGSV